MKPSIKIRGARQNTLKNLDLDLQTQALIVITGVSGSGKSSLAFDTLFAEGQRRYVETFSPYARQFLDRMDKPAVDHIEGIPPSIAIDQSNPIRNSRSSVGTLTELNDHFKLLFARAASLYCGQCGAKVEADHPEQLADRFLASHPEARALVQFEVEIPSNFDAQEIQHWLNAQGYLRSETVDEKTVRVTQDRLKLSSKQRPRLVEAIEVAMHQGHGRARIEIDGQGHAFSSDLQCACGSRYPGASPSLFSFNSPLGACAHCKGFGRVIGVDYDLVIPDPSKTLRQGAIKPFQSASNAVCQADLERYAQAKDLPLDTPWSALSAEQQNWVIEGEGSARSKRWYGVARFFDYLERRAYKMHVRVLLSRYRSYDSCPDCQGARLTSGSLLWRLGDKALADSVLAPAERFMPSALGLDRAQWAALDGLHLYDLMRLPLVDLQRFVEGLQFDPALMEITEQLLSSIRQRLAFLNDVGVGYLSLDRQSRTLSGGETQRISLSTALGTTLCNTLFVLDEPSIGLHPRDIDRVIAVMQKLRDQGNTLVVVEHDPQIMRAADRLIDMGPAAGKAGGEILFDGSPAALLADQSSITAAYLRAERSIDQALSARPVSPSDSQWLSLLGASEHNLQAVDLHIPLGRFVCVAGVSGSGKSTLIHDTLYLALRRAFGQPLDAPGAFSALEGLDGIASVELVDQGAIGRSARSTPATYTGAFEAIRKVFAKLPQAKARDYKPGSFSFSSGLRCPSCAGNGFEHIEMQFLSDVYLRCSACDGRRYTAPLLEIKMLGANGQLAHIADVLEQSVDEALVFFADHKPVLRALQPLVDVGLGYMALGQAVPTLSGGEAQRLKLAGHLAKMGEITEPTLFLFDEPTTGLHFADIAVLIAAFEPLLAAGHTVVVVEHNLDVIRAADWVIELGPDGGDQGGQIVFNGDLKALASAQTATAISLREDTSVEADSASEQTISEAPAPYLLAPNIQVRGAAQNNLKHIDLDIPREGLVVITGLSGSGKSTLAFDIVFAEGQRRYLESLNAYARQFVQPPVKAEVDALNGLPPTVAIEQRTSRGGRKSTVATATELYHFLRLLYVTLGQQHCPSCALAIHSQRPADILSAVGAAFDQREIQVFAPLIRNRKGLYKDLAAWASQKGFDALRVDGELCASDHFPALDRYQEHSIELLIDTLRVDAAALAALEAALGLALDHGNGSVLVAEAQSDTLYSTHASCPGCARSFAQLDPRLFSYNSKLGWCPQCFGTGEQVKLQKAHRQDGDPNDERALKRLADAACTACGGTRLNQEANAVRWQDRSISALCALSVAEAIAFFEAIELSPREQQIAQDVLAEIQSRLRFLQQVGLDYLALNRSAPSLSGGEAQRIRLAAQLGSNLQGVAYILDEPSIGLHPADNNRLLSALNDLSKQGNSVIVVEHDEATIRQADHLIDMGPGAGHRGGEIVAQGDLKTLLKSAKSPTAHALKNPIVHPLRAKTERAADAPRLRLRAARANNLQNIDIDLPLHQLVGVAGVSGSGKSTLIRTVLKTNIDRQLKQPQNLEAIDCDSLSGVEALDYLLEVDQSPIGKTPRSTPATYVGIWDAIRKAFANTSEAQIRGYDASRFSFNTGPGRCPVCEGKGMQTVEMNFLPDVKVVCETCAGLRFNRETLAVRFKDKSIGEVLAMEVDEAVEFFEAHPKVHYALSLLQGIGLGYLSLGQPSPTLSGGEAQRIKLVAELSKARQNPRLKPKHTLYILDEPTVGLHMADVEKLITVLHELVDAGHSCIVIEHNLDVLAECDQLIELGPGGGQNGGQLLLQAPPSELGDQDSPTANYLKTLF